MEKEEEGGERREKEREKIKAREKGENTKIKD